MREDDQAISMQVKPSADDGVQVEGAPQADGDALADGTMSAGGMAQSTGEELFPEDTGTCPLMVRHAIAALIKRRYISADEDKAAWEGLMSDPELVRSRLADALLLLRMDTRAGIAFAQQVEFEDDTVPYKIKSINYFNNVQSLLMCQLVTKYFAATAAGQTHVWVDEEEMRETMERLFEDVPDVAASEAAMKSAIGAMVRNGYLREVVEDRYQILPVVGVVYTLDEIRSVLARYAQGRGGDGRT